MKLAIKRGSKTIQALSFMAFIGLTSVLTNCAPGAVSDNSLSNSKSSEIVGGTAVTSDDIFASSIVQVFNIKYTKFLGIKILPKQVASCTGTLISDQVVISAGHCTVENPDDIYIYFSHEIPVDSVAFLMKYVDYMGHKKEVNPLVRQVLGGIVPSQLASWSDPTTKDAGDVSLLKFGGGLAAGFAPAQLIPQEAALTKDSVLTFAGFGYTDGVKQTHAVALNKVDIKVLDPQYSRSEIMLDASAAGSTCHGDSGGPGFVRISDTEYLAAVVSRSDLATDPQGQCIGKEIDNDVHSYRDWIETNKKTLEDPNFKASKINLPSWM